MTSHDGRYNLRRGPSHYQRPARVAARTENVDNDTEVNDNQNDPAPPLYSEVAGGRRSSRERTHISATPSHSSDSRNNVDEPQNDTVNRDVSVEPTPEINENRNRVGNDDSDNWRTVPPRRRRALSLDSPLNVRMIPLKSRVDNGKQAKKPVPITKAQGVAIREAEKNLSQTQRKHIDRRMEIVNQSPPHNNDDSSDESPSSHGEGPSNNNKGKTVDPRNWGAAHIPDADVNVEQQREALKNFKAIQKAQKHLNIPDPNIEKTAKKISKKKSSKPTQRRAGSEALTDQVETHIRDIVEQRPRKVIVGPGRPNNTINQITRPSQMIAPTNHLAKLLTPAKGKKPAGKQSTRRKNRGGTFRFIFKLL